MKKVPIVTDRLPKIRKKINFLLESFSKNRIKYLEILRQRGFDVVIYVLLLTELI